MDARTTCVACTNWNAYAREGDFAPCDDAIVPERVLLVGRENARMLTKGGPLLTHREHGCAGFVAMSTMVARRRASTPDLADLYAAAPAA